ADAVWYRLDLPPSPSADQPVSVSLTVATLPNLPSGLSLTAFTGTSATDLDQIAVGSGDTLEVSDHSGPVFVRVSGVETYFSLGLSETNVPASDSSPPSISCQLPSGWTSSPEVACSASDAGSPLVDNADASFDLVADVPPGVATPDAETGSRQVCNVAGTCATVGPYTIEVDRSSPVVDCTPAPRGWSATNVSVSCTASDSGSGLAEDADASFTLSTSVPAGSESASAGFSAHAPVCDKVGNCTDVPNPGTAMVDEAPPQVHCGTPPSGWLDTQGSVTCTAHDDGAGLAESSQHSFSLATAVPDASYDAKADTGSVEVCDAVGNCTKAGPVGPFEVDLSAPVVDCALPKGWSKGDSLQIPCTAHDGGSGLAPSSPSTFSLTASIPKGTDAPAASDSLRVCSVAGMCTTAGPFEGIGLADEAPRLSCDTPPTAWQPGAVTLQCAATTTGAPLAASDDAHFTLVASIPSGTTDAAVAFPSRSVCDAVGNCATTPSLPPVAIDETPPSLHCGHVPSGVQDEEVVVDCTAADSGSGLADPADASFELRTSVPAGQADASASTSSRQVCDAVGNCTTAGPFTADVDLRSAPSAAPPRIESPGTVLVLVGIAVPQNSTTAEVPVPFDLPAVAGGVGQVATECSPGPDALFRLGLTLVSCGATDQAEQSSEVGFYVSVEAVASLVPTGDAVAGAPWRAVGAGFAPGSAVRIDLGETVLASTTAGAGGQVEDTVTMPLSTPIGSATLVVRGTSSSGSPLLVVTPITVAVSRTRQLSATMPPGSPAAAPTSVVLPRRGPALPPAHILPVAGRPNGTGGAGIGPNGVSGASGRSGATGSSAPSGRGSTTGSTSSKHAGSTGHPAHQPSGIPVGRHAGRARGSGRAAGTVPTGTVPVSATTLPPAGTTPSATAAPTGTAATGTVPTGTVPTGTAVPGATAPPRRRRGAGPTTLPPSSVPSSPTPATSATGSTPRHTGPTGVAIRPSPSSRHGTGSGDLGAVLGGSLGGAALIIVLSVLVIARRRSRGALASGPGAPPGDRGGPAEGAS
ncbi:MAG TPA: hypothetical protein VMD59_21885, partial [Acidimicrobiales bacterium]|nr:hypothetical protein [Acidimicrobiales bacterium]